MFPKGFDARVREFNLNLMRKTLARTPIRANDLTVLSLVLTIGAAWLLGSGMLLAGGIAIAVASSFDMLDGALARAKNEVSQFGAFLDSTLDRYTEVLLYFGLAAHFVRQPQAQTEVLLIIAAITGSLLVSYVRARAESLGLDGKVGLLERPERIVLIVLGLVSGWLTPVLWVLAVLTHITALQRFAHVFAQIRAAGASKPADAGASKPAAPARKRRSLAE